MAEDRRLVHMYEHERWMPGGGFSSAFLASTDNGGGSAFTTLDFQPLEDLNDVAIVPQGWVPSGQWVIVKNETVDENGWEYAFNVIGQPYHPRPRASDFHRRRMWEREIVYDPTGAQDLAVARAAQEAPRKKQESVLAASGEERVYKLWEWQRWLLFGGFSKDFLLPTDPGTGAAFTDDGYRPRDKEVTLDGGWQWTSQWQAVVAPGKTDKEGWQYAWNVTVDLSADSKDWSASQKKNSFVRRRRWERKLKFVPPEPEKANMDEEMLAERNALKEERRKKHEANMAILNSDVMQEISGGGDVPSLSNMEERSSVVCLLNSIELALCEEEAALAELTNRAWKLINGAVDMSVAEEKRQAVILQKKEAVKLLRQLGSTDEDIRAKAKELDSRVMKLLQERQKTLDLLAETEN